MTQKTMITAHSGCEGTPRDSLISLDKAKELRAEAVEVDVRMDSVGTLRISHNAVSQNEYNEKATLSQVLEIVKSYGFKINLDMKESFCIRPALALAKEYGLGKDQLIISGILSPEQFYKDPDLSKDCQIFMNLEEILKYFAIPVCIGRDMTRLMTDPWKAMLEIPDFLETHLEDAIALFRDTGADVLNLPIRILNEDVLNLLKKYSIPISVWTPSTQEECSRVFSASYPYLVNVTSKMPSIAMEVRKQTLGY